MESWMQKYENKEEKKYEDILNEKLNKLLNLVDKSTEFMEEDMLDALKNIVELYETLKRSGYDFDEKDMILRKKQLAELRYRRLKQEHMESIDSESWEEYQNEENEEER